MTSINKITFQKNGSPFSNQFNDIYFDVESGYQQSEHVFIKGSKIKEQLLTTNDNITIGETGFGSGLNFILTLKLYIELSQHHKLPTLHFISTEKYPLTQAQLQKSLQCFPTLQQECQLLVSQYPENPSVMFECELLDGRITLTVYFDDATDALTQIALPRKNNGLVDTWYLDGFTPAKNPDMWTTALFSQLARLSKPQATLSTFTVAGFIRRGLEGVGFRLEKTLYLGCKNEILVGRYQQNMLNGRGYKLRPNITKPQHVSIIGGGIASACAAYMLTQNGIKVTLYCKDNHVANGASSNAIGAIFPLFHQQQDDISVFYQTAFEYATSFYQQLLNDGYHFSHSWCGLLDVSYKESLMKRQQEFAQSETWPTDLIRSVDHNEASAIANIPLKHGGLYMPKAGWIAPKELVNQLLLAARKTNRLRIETSTKIKDISQNANSSWQLHTSKGQVNASVVVYCGGAESTKMSYIKELPLTPVRGQVTSMKSNGAIKELNTVICHKGYLTPANNDIHCIGATFDKNSLETAVSKDDDMFNLHMLNTCLPDITCWDNNDIVGSKARSRCMTPDHLPVVGAMPNIGDHVNCYQHLTKDKNWRFYEQTPVVKNLYLLTGLGARGLCTAPLLAKILTADLSGSPYPVNSEMLFNLAPNRFVIRDLIKRKLPD